MQTLVPQAGWSLQFVDSEETQGQNGAAANAFDGDPHTTWHSQWQAAKPPLPHEIQLNLGAFYEVSGFRYLPRHDGKVNGRIGQYEFYVSSDGVNWGMPVAVGVLANDATEKQVLFTSMSGQYVRLRALSDHSGTDHRTSAAEINVLHTGTAANHAPDGAITAPARNVTITAGQIVNFTGSGSDPDDNTPLTHLWTFGTGSGLPNATPPNPGAMRFVTPGIYTVSFIVTDARNLADPTPATRTITVQNPGEATLIPQTGWSVQYVDSQETQAMNGAATNAFDGDPETLWHSQWQAARPMLPHEIQINLGAVYDVAGFRYFPRHDGKVNGRIGQFEFYVSSDGVNWGKAVASGLLANDAMEKQVLFAAKRGQYVRVRALTDFSGTHHRTAVAEINVLQAGTAASQAPEIANTSPAGRMPTTAAQTQTYSGSRSDSQNNTPRANLGTPGTKAGASTDRFREVRTPPTPGHAHDAATE